MKIYQLFPEPVYVSKLERALTAPELTLVEEYKKKAIKNIGNTTSEDNYVLEHKVFKNLKQELYKIVLDYFDKVVSTSNPITPFITQSWLNYTTTNQFHYPHSHKNSYVSGVFYINVNKDMDQIHFYRGGGKSLELSVATPNVFNSPFSWHTIETGNVFLFPSSLEHGVENKKGTNTRISLAFNVFFKGTFGDKKNLTELVL